MNVLDILELLESDGSRLAKEAVIRTHAENPTLRRFFSLSFDPWKNWGVAKYNKHLIKGPGARGHGDELVVEFLDLLIRLDKRELSGNAARSAVQELIASGDSTAQKWLERLLWRNLRCGVSVTTINKFWPGTVVPFAVALAQTLPTNGVNGTFEITEPVNYPVRVEAKLDGLRVIAVKNEGVVTLFTRNGTVLETLPRITAAITALPYDNFVFDGEAMGDSWNDSASIVMSSRTKKDDSAMCYHVFDMIPFEDWSKHESTLTYTERLVNLTETLKSVTNSPFRLVRNRTCASEAGLRDFYTSCLDEGYEGVMLKDVNATYQWKRSAAILKLKPTATEEGVVVGWYVGREATKRAGKFGGFIVLTPNGTTTRVGGGYTDDLKTQIFNDGPETYKGRIVECEHQPSGLVGEKMRFPVFMRFRDSSDVDPKVMAAYEVWGEAQ